MEQALLRLPRSPSLSFNTELTGDGRIYRYLQRFPRPGQPLSDRGARDGGRPASARLLPHLAAMRSPFGPAVTGRTTPTRPPGAGRNPQYPLGETRALSASLPSPAPASRGAVRNGRRRAPARCPAGQRDPSPPRQPVSRPPAQQLSPPPPRQTVRRPRAPTATEKRLPDPSAGPGPAPASGPRNPRSPSPAEPPPSPLAAARPSPGWLRGGRGAFEPAAAPLGQWCRAEMIQNGQSAPASSAAPKRGRKAAFASAVETARPGAASWGWRRASAWFAAGLGARAGDTRALAQWGCAGTALMGKLVAAQMAH